MQGLYPGLKVYSLSGGDDGDDKDVLKFKSFIRATETVGKAEMAKLAVEKQRLSESRTEFRPYKGRMEMLSRTVTAGGYRAAINYKHKLLDNGDVASF